MIPVENIKFMVGDREDIVKKCLALCLRHIKYHTKEDDNTYEFSNAYEPIGYFYLSSKCPKFAILHGNKLFRAMKDVPGFTECLFSQIPSGEQNATNM